MVSTTSTTACAPTSVRSHRRAHPIHAAIIVSSQRGREDGNGGNTGDTENSRRTRGPAGLLRAAVGGELARDALQRAFGVPTTSVLLGCDAHCRLARVGFCLAKDAGDHPTAPVACTANVTTSEYDNGCVTRGCERVAIQAAGACAAR